MIVGSEGGSGASLVADGTNDENITFNSVDPVKSWSGIRFNNSRDNVLSHVIIKNICLGNTRWLTDNN